MPFTEEVRAILPHRKAEAWKYADLSFLKKWNFELKPAELDPEVFKKHFLENAFNFVFVNGRYVKEASLPPNLDSVEVRYGSVSPLFEDEWESTNPFFLLNANQVEETLSIQIKADLKKPLHFIHFNTSDGEAAAYGGDRVQVHCEGNVDVLQTFCGKGRYLSNSRFLAKVEEGKKLTVVRHQADPLEAANIGILSVVVAEGATADLLSVSHGGAFHRLNGNAYLRGKTAHCRFNGLYMADGKQFVDHHANIVHEVEETTSEQLFKGVLSGKSRAVFNGRVSIVQDAQRSDSSQLNKNLMLTNEAEVDTKPELAIEADDVKAAHGATVGQIDQEEVFYLMSRGVPRAQAELLLGRGFALDVIEELDHPVFTPYLEQQLSESLTQYFGGVSGN